MSNGNEVLIDLNNVSLTLLEKARQAGRPRMPNLSVFAREMIHNHSTGHTKYTSQHYPFPNLPGEKELRLELKRAELFSTYSTNELVDMDMQGIKILTKIDYDHLDRSWAD